MQYLRDIEQLPEAKACHAPLLAQFAHFQKNTAALRDLIARQFKSITQWQMAKAAFACHPTPYCTELNLATGKTPALLKKPFVSLQDAARQKYWSYGFAADALRLVVAPLPMAMPHADGFLDAQLKEDGFTKRMGIRFRPFDVQGQALDFPQRGESSYVRIQDLEFVFWLNEHTQISVQLDAGQNLYTSAFVYAEDQRLLYSLASKRALDVRNKASADYQDVLKVPAFDEKGCLLSIRHANGFEKRFR